MLVLEYTNRSLPWLQTLHSGIPGCSDCSWYMLEVHVVVEISVVVMVIGNYN